MGTILGIVGNVFGSALAGGASGFLGVVLQRFFDWLHVREETKQKKQDQEFELSKKRIDVEIADKEWAGRTRIADTEAGAAKDVAESNAFAASLLREPERYSERTLVTTSQNWLLVILDFVRGIVRPGLTLYLCVLVSMIWFEAKSLIAAEDITAEQALKIILLLIDAVIYVWTTCTLWYFGTRNRVKQPGS